MEQTIAVVGGTGNLGAALARRWAKAGKKVIIGSRTAEKAQEAAVRLSAGLDTAILSASNLDAARAADMIFEVASKDIHAYGLPLGHIP